MSSTLERRIQVDRRDKGGKNKWGHSTRQCGVLAGFKTSHETHHTGHGGSVLTTGC